MKSSEKQKFHQKESFYSKLNDCDITDEDYEPSKNIWNEFKVKNVAEGRSWNLGDYHDPVFKEFRNVCLENYSLDPAWYYTAPGLA